MVGLSTLGKRKVEGCDILFAVNVFSKEYGVHVLYNEVARD